MPTKILIIDDDRDLTEMLAKVFDPLGYEIFIEYDGKQGLRSAYENHPDVIILDIMMPDMDGFEVCARLRKMSQVPILMLTAKTTDEDVVKGFGLGADDYVKKPFNFRELQARVEMLLHRKSNPASTFDDGVLRIELKKRMVVRKGNAILLTPTEYRLLAYFVKNRNRTLSHQELLKQVWGTGYEDGESILSNYVHYLREKLEKDPDSPKYICTEHGKGYKFVTKEKKR